MLSKLIAAACRTLAKRLPVRVITGADGTPYLSRYTIFNFPGGTRHLYLHQFHRSDEDIELHNHPWTRSVSLVLSGGYSEERRVDNWRLHREGENVDPQRMRFNMRTGGALEVCDSHVERREIKPGSINVIDADTFHRVELRDGEAWTLFLSGRFTQRWGFWDRNTQTYTDYKTFLQQKGLVPIGEDH